jgi:hypothetical protein
MTGVSRQPHTGQTHSKAFTETHQETFTDQGIPVLPPRPHVESLLELRLSQIHCKAANTPFRMACSFLNCLGQFRGSPKGNGLPFYLLETFGAGQCSCVAPLRDRKCRKPRKRIVHDRMGPCLQHATVLFFPKARLIPPLHPAGDIESAKTTRAKVGVWMEKAVMR